MHIRYYIRLMCNFNSLFLVCLCKGCGAARNFFTASSDRIFYPPMYLVFFFQSSSSPAFVTSLLTQSSHLSIGLPRLLLPYSRNYAALFGSLSSAILSTCPAHYNLLLLLFLVPSCFRTLAGFVVVVRSVPRFPFPTCMPM